MKHLHRDLELLRGLLHDLGDRVETAIDDALRALFERDEAAARRVLQREAEIDALEVHVEEECLKVLALHQPVAGDLRFVVTVLKADNDLERMGDAAESIASRSLQLQEQGDAVVPQELRRMADDAVGMVQKALRCMLLGDAALAQQVLADDAAVDAGQRKLFELLQAEMAADRQRIPGAVLLLSVTRQVERLADLATNIAEDVIFLRDGEIVRHKRRELRLLRGAEG